MQENELFEVLSNFKNAIDILQERMNAIEGEYSHVVEDVNGRLDKLEKTFFEDILEPAQQAALEGEEMRNIDDLRSRYAEDIDSYNNKLRPIEGEDFDLAREAYKGFNDFNSSTDDKMEEADYMAALFEKVDEQLETIKGALGAETVTAEVDENGDTKIVADGEDVTEEVKEGGAEEVTASADDELSPEEREALEAQMRAEGLIK